MPATQEQIDFSIVCETAKDKLGADQARIGPETRVVEDLGADSLGILDFWYELEERFGKPGKPLEVSNEAFQSANPKTLGDYFRLICATRQLAR